MTLTLDSLPLTSSGKPDRAHLGTEDVAVTMLERPVELPRNALEREICAVWQDTLDLDRVGIHESFFDLGGHSLLAVRARTLLENRLGRALKITDLFQHSTPASLADHRLAADSQEQCSEHTGRGESELAQTLPASVGVWRSE